MNLPAPNPAEPSRFEHDSLTVSGGEAVAIALETLSVRTVFAIPSAHNLTILRTIEQRGNIRVVLCRHEQGVAHAADGYARTTGQLGVGIVSGGPGTANAMGGLYEAHFASSPVMLITSQVATPLMGRGRGYVHEAEQQATMLGTVTSEAVTITAAADIADTVIRLGRKAIGGRPRPVAVEIPIDLQDEPVTIVVSDLESAVRRVRPAPQLAPAALERAGQLLAAARRPVIWAGGGVNRGGASAELLALARLWNAPVLTSREGRGAIDESDPLSIGGYATLGPVREFLADCDVLLAVGTRFQMYPTAEWNLALPPVVVHLDVDPTVIGRSYPVDVALVTEATFGLRALTEALGAQPIPDAQERAKHLAVGQQAAAAARRIVEAQAGPDHLRISQTVDALRPADGALVCDATVPAYVWGDRLVKIRTPRSSIRATAAGIGPGLPLAIGAAVATDRHAVLLQGDGGFMLSIGEMATAVQAQAKVIICVFDDAGYAMLRDIEETIGDGYIHHVDLAAPNFAQMAASYGMATAAVGDPAAFDTAFRNALEHAGPTLIHIDMASLAPLRRRLTAVPAGELS